ncbi:MAG: crotonyl-CoA carboxylase/reductase [Candidatus Dormibacteraeota bacterium]|nr:crotonyl-CoA carboxylase/reductase [Candidatus Dormibacteraeota bacterium]MBV8445747.1 crotonyl-CoA carboxylase/reductase [Candidatus Dormibacteraeota bacterium]
MATAVNELGGMPSLGEVPEQMVAQLIRPERYGDPLSAFKEETVATPLPRAGEVLVYVMAAGVNYNNVWAALGRPVDVIAARQKAGESEAFHIGGSDASGIVWAVGEGVSNVKVGDHVVAHCGVWDPADPWIVDGGDPIVSPSARIWGYETNWGSFAQFTRVQSHQLVPKPTQLSWAAAAAYMLVGATAYRMLTGWPPHDVQENDVVLVWGGSGGLGSQAIQIAKAKGAIPIAVTSGEERGRYCMKLGARGWIDRRDFNHWGIIPDWRDDAAFAEWLKGARSFGARLWEVLGERRNPRIVFEHPGESTIPTSMFVCDNGGMVVICAGTTGYHAAVDLRYLWMRQKRLQGSHFANDEQCAAFNEMVARDEVDPCLSRTFAFDEVGLAHSLMHENKHPMGNMAILVGARDADQVDV